MRGNRGDVPRRVTLRLCLVAEKLDGCPVACRSQVVGITARQSVDLGVAGTLEVAPGVRLVDTENMPDEYKPLAQAHADAFDIYRTAGDLEWTYLTPPPEFMPGDRTGTYRAEGDSYLAGEDGRSRLSYADMAVAVADTIEQGTHKGARVAVAY